MAKKTQGTEVEEAPKTFRPEAVADELGISGKQVRAYLRSNFSRSAEEKGTTWTLTEKMRAAVIEHFTVSDEEDDELEEDNDLEDDE